MVSHFYQPLFASAGTKKDSVRLGDSAIVSSTNVEQSSVAELSNVNVPSPSNTVEAGQLPSPASSDIIVDTPSPASEAVEENVSPVSEPSTEQTTSTSYVTQLLGMWIFLLFFIAYHLYYRSPRSLSARIL